MLDVLGEVLHWGGQLVVSYVLVGLAYGWTLSSRAVQKYIPDDKVKPGSGEGCFFTPIHLSGWADRAVFDFRDW